MILFCVILWAAVSMLLGCSTYRAHYDIGLMSVERPAQAVEKYGAQDITTFEEKGSDRSFYEDGLVRIVWIPTASEVSFELTNKTEQPLKIIWEEAAFIDDSGESHRVVHSGVDYESVKDPQPSTVINEKGSYADAVFPAGYYHYIGGTLHKDPLYPNVSVSRKGDKLEEKGQSFIGKTFHVLLPLEIDGVVNKYVFSFTVVDVEVE